MDLKVLRDVLLYALPVLVGVVAHEVAHGWVADKLGDPTARERGRITINPLVHIDPVGTVILPLALLLLKSPFLFGWAKPVPVHFERLRGGRRAMAWVAMAGPLTNLLIAAFAALVFRGLYLGFRGGWLQGSAVLAWMAEPALLMAYHTVAFNVALMVINLFPVPPLDGGRIAVGLLPFGAAQFWARLERYGMLLLIVLLATGVLSMTIRPIMTFLIRFFVEF